MTHNKILTAAVVAALSMGGGMAQAVGLSVTAPSSGSTIDAGIAYELFDPADPSTPPVSTDYQALPDGCSGTSCYSVKYEFETDLTIYENVTVKFTLTNARFISTALPNLIVTNAGGDTHAVTVSSGDLDTTNFTYFSKLIEAKEANIDNQTVNGDDHYLLLDQFQIEVLEQDFAQPGQQVELTIDVTSAQSGVTDTQKKTLAKTVTGYTPKITLNPKVSKIDMGEPLGTRFTLGSVNSDMRANLGTVEYEVNNTATTKDMTTLWSTTGTSARELKITKLPTLPQGGTTDAVVFLDSNAACSSTPVPDYTATLDGTEAEWTAIANAKVTLANTNVCIKLPNDSDAVIVQHDEPPRAFFKATYSNPTVEVKAEGDLGHIKRNAALCSVYIVTSDTMNDVSNVRISNLSTQAADVIGTLRNMQNEVVCEKMPLGNVPAGGTIRVSSTDLQNLVEDTAGCDITKWTNRGVLTIGGGISSGNMEVFLLLRRKTDLDDGHSYPLINMSLGASGNACE